ncbi:MAG: crossover junction endodeoxyribonuclease RuvC, partial [Betaproteobacteria bacterium]|nr:crossover junction endodeoxyribonuclease RuvC [Betaproteobacteria bacterium]
MTNPAKRLSPNRSRRQTGSTTLSRPAATAATVLGIDPGLARTGIGVIRHAQGAFQRIHAEVIRTDANLPIATRLARISERVRECATKYRPAVAAVERVFVNVNPHSSLQLGQARGAALAALGESEVPVVEISPNAVKKNLTGDSNADKRQVAAVVRRLLA